MSFLTARITWRMSHLNTLSKAWVNGNKSFSRNAWSFSTIPILSRAQNGYGGLTQAFNSKLAELEIDGGGDVITGSKTIQVEIKE